MRIGWNYSNIVENKGRFFPKGPPISLTFLWMVGHVINYIYCILDLTNSVREIGRDLATNSTF